MLKSKHRPPLPPRMRHLPKFRELPIPVSVVYDANGEVDFRVIDLGRWMRLMRDRRCGICGYGLGKSMAFIGGPKSIEGRVFTDLPMHRLCAEYALQVCPYLALPFFKHATHIPEPAGFDTVVNELASNERPERFGLGLSPGYGVELLSNGHPVVIAEPFTAVMWWRHGERLKGEA